VKLLRSVHAKREAKRTIIIQQYNYELDTIKKIINEAFANRKVRYYVYSYRVTVDGEEYKIRRIPFIGSGCIYLLHDGRLAFFQSFHGEDKVINTSDHECSEICDHMISLEHVNVIPKSSPIGLDMKEIINLRKNIAIEFC